MKNLFYLSFIVLLLAGCGYSKNQTSQLRQKIKIDQDWKFHFGEVANAENVDFEDAGWRKLNLPHDWTVEMPIKKENASTVNGGFVQGGVGWYRKNLTVPADTTDKKVYLMFDGIYENSTVWINGHKLGGRQNGYVTHYYDITQHLEEEKNVLAVKVDASRQPADRWFSGAGITRHAWLHVTDKLHVPVWGTYVTTPEVSADNATVQLITEVKNDYQNAKEIEVTTQILDPEGNVFLEDKQTATISADANGKVNQQFAVDNPRLWSIESPNLYQAKTTIKSAGEIHDEYTTTFGIREVAFTAEQGFLLNGEKVMLKGVNLHHDAGPLGAAIPLAVWQRRLDILKEMGVNTIRLSHNPHDPMILDLCDEMGLLVYDEMYDKWAIPWQHMDDSVYVAERKQVFQENWRRDLTDFIDRDKNHPSVIIWSVGNETREQLFDPEAGVKIGKELMGLVQGLDPTRKVTAAMHPRNKDSEFPSRLMQIFDVVSYNYETHHFADWRSQNPEMIFIASETKLYNNPFHTIPFDTVDFSKNSWFEIEDWMAGQYIWAGIDYLGESFAWPDKGFRGGVLYTNGFAKPSTGFTQSIYSDKPMVKIAVHSDSLAAFYNAQDTWQKSWWPPALVDHWNFSENKMIDVYAFTNLENVELFLNEKSLGAKSKSDYKDGVVRWRVPYQAGTLKAHARRRLETMAEDQLVTAGNATSLKLYPEKDNISADNDDIVHVLVQLEDEKGIRNAVRDQLVSLELEGPGKIIGVDNGNLADHYDWKGNKLKLMDGRCMVYVQADGEQGLIKLKVEGSNLKSDLVEIEVVKK